MTFPIVLVIIEAPKKPKLRALDKGVVGSLVCLPTNFNLSDFIKIGSEKSSFFS